MKKYISAIVILLALGVAAFVLSQKKNGTTTDTPPQNATTTEQMASTTDIFSQPPIIPKAKVSTEGWKTCRNEEYGYEFKFPPEWHIYGADALGEPNALGKRNYVRESKECNGASVGLSEMSIEDYKKGGVVNKRGVGIEIYRPHSRYPFANIKKLMEKKKHKAEQHYILLDGHDALLQIYTNIYVTNWYVTSWVNDDVYRLGGNKYKNDAKLIETILSTFHFLDIATSTSTQK